VSPLDTVFELSLEQLTHRLCSDSPPTVIDIREPWEFEKSHLSGSCSIPLSDLDWGDLKMRFSYQTPLVLICHNGAQSYPIALHLSSLGFQSVAHLKGGFTQ
jgi:rhodanese-related sulfurtransferase